MRSFEDDPLGDDELDLDRIIIDAEYRSRVLARLRQQRAGAEDACQVSVSLASDTPRFRPEK